MACLPAGRRAARWKGGVNALRTTTYGELLKIGAEHGYSKAWADSFFRPFRADREEEEETPEPAPVAPPA